MSEILDQVNSREDIKRFRNKLIPIWMRMSSWFFMGLSVVLPIVIGYTFYYRYEKTPIIESNLALEQIYLAGFGLLIAVMLLSGITGYAILTKRRWAIVFGIVYASFSLVVYGYSLINQFNYSLLTIELLLVFFLYHLITMRKSWERGKA